jgi:hypothetical protein
MCLELFRKNITDDTCILSPFSCCKDKLECSESGLDASDQIFVVVWCLFSYCQRKL